MGSISEKFGFGGGGTAVYWEIARAGTYTFKAPVTGRYFACVVGGGAAAAAAEPPTRERPGAGAVVNVAPAISIWWLARIIPSRWARPVPPGPPRIRAAQAAHLQSMR